MNHIKISLYLSVLIISLFSGQDFSGVSFCLDPGHGGETSRAVGPTGLAEKEINLSLSERESIANGNIEIE